MVEQQLIGPGGATEVTLAAVLIELGQKLEAGQAVALDAGTLAALETISVLGPLTNAELRAADVNMADSGERLYTHVVATVTASGDTTIHTPAVGTRIRLRWIYAINDPASPSPPLIKVRLGATEFYRVWALSKRQLVQGAVDAPLIINLTGTGTVAVTAILEEV